MRGKGKKKMIKIMKRILGILCAIGCAFVISGCGDDYEGRWITRDGSKVTEMIIEKDDSTYDLNYIVYGYVRKESVQEENSPRREIHNLNYEWKILKKGKTFLIEKDGELSESARLTYFPLTLKYIEDKDALSWGDGMGLLVRKNINEMQTLQDEAKKSIQEADEKKYEEESRRSGGYVQLGTITFNDGKKE